MVDSKDNYEFDLGVEGLTHLCECFPGQSSVTLSGIAEIILQCPKFLIQVEVNWDSTVE